MPPEQSRACVYGSAGNAASNGCGRFSDGPSRALTVAWCARVRERAAKSFHVETQSARVPMSAMHGTSRARCPNHRHTVLENLYVALATISAHKMPQTYLNFKLLSERWAFRYPLRIHARTIDTCRYLDSARCPKDCKQYGLVLYALDTVVAIESAGGLLSNARVQ